MSAVIVALALLLDKCFGEVNRLHPLVGFAAIASALERSLNHHKFLRLKGFMAWLLAVLPWVAVTYAIAAMLSENRVAYTLFSAGVLYLAIGWQSLLQHAQAVVLALKSGDIEQAREKVSMIVSRQCQQLDEEQVAKACCESVLENGADAIFAPIFWAVLLGPWAVVLYRLANTLDAMWGYRNARYKDFGFAAAKIDDVLNFIPARLCALSYLLSGNRQKAWHCMQKQAPLYQSPNAGLVMAAGAGSLQLHLGGVAYYHGQQVDKPVLGVAQAKSTGHSSIQACCRLVSQSVGLWLLVIMALAVL